MSRLIIVKSCKECPHYISIKTITTISGNCIKAFRVIGCSDIGIPDWCPLEKGVDWEMTLHIDMMEEEFKDTIMSIKTGDITCEEAIDVILLYQSKNRVTVDRVLRKGVDWEMINSLLDEYKGLRDSHWKAKARFALACQMICPNLERHDYNKPSMPYCLAVVALAKKEGLLWAEWS